MIAIVSIVGRFALPLILNVVIGIVADEIIDKANLDNRSRQLNPENNQYWKSRGLNKE